MNPSRRDRLTVAADVVSVLCAVFFLGQVAWYVVTAGQVPVAPLVLAVVSVAALLLRRRRRKDEERAGDAPVVPSRASLVGTVVFFGAVCAVCVVLAASDAATGMRVLGVAGAVASLPFVVLGVVGLVRYDGLARQLAERRSAP